MVALGKLPGNQSKEFAFAKAADKKQEITFLKAFVIPAVFQAD